MVGFLYLGDQTQNPLIMEQPVKSGWKMEMVISNHFLCKDLVHHPIDSQPLVNGWQSYFTHIFFQPD